MRLLRETLLHLGTEVRFGLRDPHILGYTLWMPLFLYPVLIFATFQVLAVREGRASMQRYTVAVPPLHTTGAAPVGSAEAPAAEEALRFLKNMPRVSLLTGQEIPGGAAARDEYLRREGLDGLVAFHRDGEELQIELIHRGVAGDQALVKRFEEAVEKFRTSHGRRTLRSAGVRPDRIAVTYVNAATSREMGDFVLARLLPVTLVIFLGTGAFYASIDVTAGERERGTLETTLLSPSRRSAIVAGKLLYVMAAAITSALVNLLSLSLTLGHAFSLLGPGIEIRVAMPAGALPLVLLGLAVLSAAVCPLMMGLAFLTRSFREGQSYVGPVYALLVTPTVVASLPGMVLDYKMALVPMVNLTLGLKEIIEGKGFTLPLCVALLETLAIGALFVAMAARILSQEEAVLSGSESGAILKTLRRVLAARAA